MPVTIEMIEKHYDESVSGQVQNRKEISVWALFGKEDMTKQQYYENHPLYGLDTLTENDTDVRPIINWLISVVEKIKENPLQELEGIDAKLFPFWKTINNLALLKIRNDIFKLENDQKDTGLQAYINRQVNNRHRRAPYSWIGSLENLVNLAELSDRHQWAIMQYPNWRPNQSIKLNTLSSRIRDFIILLEKNLTEWNEEYSPNSEDYAAKTKTAIFELLLKDTANITFSTSMDTLAENEILDFSQSPIEQTANSYVRKLREVSSTFFKENIA